MFQINEILEAEEEELDPKESYIEEYFEKIEK